MSERLPLPIKRALAERDDAAALARVRDRIDASIDQRRGRAATRIALAFAAVILVAVAFAAGRLSSPAEATRAEAEANGVVALASLESGSRHALADGTTIELAANSELRVREERADRVTLVLERGRARFTVAKRKMRVFRVEAGDVVATVRGTAFSIARSGDRATVEVDEGSVEVASPAGTRTLVAGERFGAVEPVESGVLGGDRAESDAAEPAAPLDVRPHDAAAAPRRDSVAPWRPLAAKGDWPAAYAALGSAGVVREVDAAIDAETLFSLADVARLSGHPKDAALPLRRILSEHRADPRASLAAFTLGKMELDSLGDAREASRHFDEAIKLGPPASIAEDAAARRVEAHARAGDAGKARAAAAEYRAKYPAGRYEAEVTKWASGTP